MGGMTFSGRDRRAPNSNPPTRAFRRSGRNSVDSNRRRALSGHPQHEELLLSFLQADVSARDAHFADFLRELKDVATQQGNAAARPWARRAVSPLLDYSSLLKLRRFLIPGPNDQQPDSTGNRESGSTRTTRLAILGGPTTIQLRQLIELFLAAEGIAAEIYEADYGLFRQEILTPGSGLDPFRPDVDPDCHWCAGRGAMSFARSGRHFRRATGRRRNGGLGPALGNGTCPLERDADPEQFRDRPRIGVGTLLAQTSRGPRTFLGAA